MVSCDKAETEEEQNYCFTEPNSIKQDNLERYVLFVENNDLYLYRYIILYYTSVNRHIGSNFR